MDDFWKRQNRRIGKLIDERGPSAEWSKHDYFVDIGGLGSMKAHVADLLEKRLSATRLGELVEGTSDTLRIATTAGTRGGYLYSLLAEELRRADAPRDVLVREGYPVPTVARRIYPTDRDTNLTPIGKGSKKKPTVGDVFAYSFDGETFFWGQVVRDDLHYMGAENVSVFYRASTDALTPPVLDPKNLLLEPLALDAGAWRKGYFTTVANSPVPAGEFPWDGWTPSSSLDAHLSAAHGIPLLAPK